MNGRRATHNRETNTIRLLKRYGKIRRKITVQHEFEKLFFFLLFVGINNKRVILNTRNV